MSDINKKAEQDENNPVMGSSIGEQLRTHRKARGISLVEVTEHTKIGKKYLEALEEERYDFLPCETYIQGFLRAYAKYLELDDEKIIQHYLEVRNLTAPEESKNEPEEEVKTNNQSVWAPLLAIMVLAGLGAGLFLLWPVGQEGTVAETDTVVPVAINAAVAETPLSHVPGPNEMLSLKIKAKEKTWITLMIDGRQEPDVTINTNEERSWKANDRFVLWTGNAGGIEVYFNGELQPALGKPGEVRKEVIFERKNPVIAPEQDGLN